MGLSGATASSLMCDLSPLLMFKDPSQHPLFDQRFILAQTVCHSPNRAGIPSNLQPYSAAYTLHIERLRVRQIDVARLDWKARRDALVLGFANSMPK